MRIREIIFRDFRNFRGERRISFVDPLTDQVRPITVLAGTNGTGKTTILDAIETLLRFSAGEVVAQEGLFREALRSGYIRTILEASPNDLQISNSQVSSKLPITVGRFDYDAEALRDSDTDGIFMLNERKKPYDDLTTNELETPILIALQETVARMQAGRVELHGGLIYLPQERRFEISKGGTIQPPTAKAQWIYRYSSSSKWRGSLEEFWVWQNYLDLEQRAKGPAANGTNPNNFKTFVATLENTLGEGSEITVEQGRVQVNASWKDNDGAIQKLRIDQLPSGERQILLMFGELARHRRPGAIIMIDEPELNLHPALQRLVMHQLRTLAREWDAQIIVATHSLEILRAVHESSRIYLDHLEATQPTTPITD